MNKFAQVGACRSENHRPALFVNKCAATPAELRKRAAANDGKHAFNPV